MQNHTIARSIRMPWTIILCGAMVVLGLNVGRFATSPKGETAAQGQLLQRGPEYRTRVIDTTEESKNNALMMKAFGPHATDPYIPARR